MNESRGVFHQHAVILVDRNASITLQMPAVLDFFIQLTRRARIKRYAILRHYVVVAFMMKFH